MSNFKTHSNDAKKIPSLNVNFYLFFIIRYIAINAIYQPHKKLD